MALAVLSKGPVGLVLPGGAPSSTASSAHDCAAGRAWTRLGLLLFLVIAAPWFVLVSRRNPGFARFFFIHEHVERFLTTHHREGAWWYFLPELLWACCHGWALRGRMRAADRGPRARHRYRTPARSLVAWSSSSSALRARSCPLHPADFPALAFLADALSRGGRAARRRLLVGASCYRAWSALVAVPVTRPARQRAAADAARESRRAGRGAVASARRPPAGVAPRARGRRCGARGVGARRGGRRMVLLLGHQTFGAAAQERRSPALSGAALSTNTPVYAVGLLRADAPLLPRRGRDAGRSTHELEFGLGQEPGGLPTRGLRQRWSQGRPGALAP